MSFVQLCIIRIVRVANSKLLRKVNSDTLAGTVVLCAPLKLNNRRIIGLLQESA